MSAHCEHCVNWTLWTLAILSFIWTFVLIVANEQKTNVWKTTTYQSVIDRSMVAISLPPSRIEIVCSVFCQSICTYWTVTKSSLPTRFSCAGISNSREGCALCVTHFAAHTARAQRAPNGQWTSQFSFMLISATVGGSCDRLQVAWHLIQIRKRRPHRDSHARAIALIYRRHLFYANFMSHKSPQ